MAGIDSDLIRGHIDTIILKSLYHGDKYGLEIIQEIEEKSNGSYELKQPTLYSCLKRLESQGLISSYWEDSEIGGKRHYYTLTELGKESYKNNQEEWMRSREIIDNLIYNTTIDYAPIYDNDAEQNEISSNNDEQAPIVDTLQEEDPELEAQDVADVADNESENHKENQPENIIFINENLSVDETIEDEETDYLAEDSQIDEFASFDEIESTAFNTFFDSKTESANENEFEEDEQSIDNSVIEIKDVPITESLTEIEPNDENRTQEDDDEIVALTIEDIDNDEINESTLETESANTTNELPEEPNTFVSFVDAYTTNYLQDSNSDSDSLHTEGTIDSDNQQEETIDEASDDDEIYNPEPEIPEDEQIYVPESDEDTIIDIPNEEPLEDEPVQPEIITPTYINFDNTDYDEADITNQELSEEIKQEETPFTENYFLEIEPDDNEELGIKETAEKINEQYNSQTYQRASQEEIESLYRTTENYENLQAGYTDETYKQMLNELESYGSSAIVPDAQHNKTNILNYSELSNDLEKEGIVIRKHEKQIRESNDTKIYIKTNRIHLITNWITFGVSAFALLLTFLIMNAFKESYTYNFAFWQFAVAAGVALLIPLFSSIKYAINPYKKVVAKYAPRLNILISVLITIQLIMIIYCVNLQLGFYSFSQENYNHLLWILPLLLSFIPTIQALVYLPLYNSKNYHT